MDVAGLPTDVIVFIFRALMFGHVHHPTVHVLKLNTAYTKVLYRVCKGWVPAAKQVLDDSVNMTHSKRPPGSKSDSTVRKRSVNSTWRNENATPSLIAWFYREHPDSTCIEAMTLAATDDEATIKLAISMGVDPQMILGESARLGLENAIRGAGFSTQTCTLAQFTFVMVILLENNHYDIANKNIDSFESTESFRRKKRDTPHASKVVRVNTFHYSLLDVRMHVNGIKRLKKFVANRNTLLSGTA
jgi:hypothetical protein